MTHFPGDKRPGLRPSAALERQTNYAEAASWAADIHGALRASRRAAWIVAGAAGLVAVLEALALAALSPLKTVVPYTILVDRQTGYVQTVEGLKPGALSQDAAVTQSFLVQYVIARETFDAADLRENYRKVMLWSAQGAREAYRQDMLKTNPTSPLVVNTPTTIVQTVIKSVSLLTPTTALVRFETTRRDGGAGPADVRNYVAVLAFRYTGAPMRMEDRFINPLGFQVVSYRRDAESAPGVSSRPDASNPPGGSVTP
jgi:type IV secretion system protein VirB8